MKVQERCVNVLVQKNTFLKNCYPLFPLTPSIIYMHSCSHVQFFPQIMIILYYFSFIHRLEIIFRTTQMSELIPYISLLLHHLPIVSSNNLVSQSTDMFSSLLPVLHVFCNMSQ